MHKRGDTGGGGNTALPRHFPRLVTLTLSLHGLGSAVPHHHRLITSQQVLRTQSLLMLMPLQQSMSHKNRTLAAWCRRVRVRVPCVRLMSPPAPNSYPRSTRPPPLYTSTHTHTQTLTRPPPPPRPPRPPAQPTNRETREAEVKGDSTLFALWVLVQGCCRKLSGQSRDYRGNRGTKVQGSSREWYKPRQ